MSDRVTVTCEACSASFDRYRCHPYITKCPACRKGKSKQAVVMRKQTNKKAKSTQYVDGHAVNKEDVRGLLAYGQRGCEGRYHSSKDSIDMVTYSDKGKDGKRFRWYRIAKTYYASEEILRSAFDL